MLTTPLQTAVRYCLVNGTHTTGLRAYSPPPSNVWQQVFGRSASLRQQKLICHLLSCGVPVPLLIGDISAFLQASYFLTRPPAAVYYTFQ
ncbi:hypothetical protein TNCV_422631 [Trichonephila clavipes]|nr:hypothetical protein TNCV_422631 [Trichonephila clavipes]